MTHWPHMIRDVADFPKPGIVFKEITPVLADAAGFAAAIDAMAAPWRGQAIDELTALRGRERWNGTAPLKAALVA